MADISTPFGGPINWEIEPARKTFNNQDNRFDQATQSDQPFGPEPELNPPAAAPEVDGKGLPGKAP